MGELRYDIVAGMLAEKGLDVKKVSDSLLSQEIGKLETMIKNNDIKSFGKVFSYTTPNGWTPHSFMNPEFKKLIKGEMSLSGKHFSAEKLQNTFDLLRKVPVVGAPLVVGGALQGGETLGDPSAETKQYKRGGRTSFKDNKRRKMRVAKK